MAADKPLQDVFSTVRLPVTDSSVALDNKPTKSVAFTDGLLYFNCYPIMATDKVSNQYASQFDTYIQKRGPIIGTGVVNITNAGVPTADVTEPWSITCITALEDTFIAAVYDSTLGTCRIVQFRPYTGTTTLIGSIPGVAVGDSVYVSELSIGGLPYIGVVWTNAAETSSTGYYASSTAGVFNSLTAIAGNFSGTIAPLIVRGPLVQMDGYTFALTKDGKIYHSDINTITTWNTLTMVQAISYPDQGVALRRYKNHIVCFGEDSIEFFNNQGFATPKSCLGRTDQAFIKSGAMHANGTIALDDTLYWFARSSGNKTGLWKLDGYTPVKVSSIKDDLAINRTQSAGFFPELYLMYDHGKQHLISNIFQQPQLLRQLNGYSVTGDPFPPAALSFYGGYLCWDIGTTTSWIFSRDTTFSFPLMAPNFSSSGLYRTMNACITMWASGAPRQSAGTAGLGNIVFQTTDATTSGSAQDYYKDHTDDKLTYLTIGYGMQFNVWDFGTEKRKRIHKFKVLRRFIQSPSAGGGIPWTWVVYSKRDGAPENDTAHTTNNSTVYFKRACKPTAISNRAVINNLGSARQWYFAIAEKSDGPGSIKGVELDISQSTN